MNTKQVGEIAEACVLTALLKAGYVVLTPFGGNQRYDFVVEKNGVFLRIQCKSGRICDGCVIFQTSSAHAYHGKCKRDYYGDAELFAVYCRELDKMYIVPVDDVGCSSTQLRLEPTQNGQEKKSPLGKRL